MPAPAATYERVVYKNPSKYHYMKVCLEFQDCGVGLNAAQFKQLLISAVKDLFGEVDAALPLDILTYEEKTLSAILRICSSGLVKLWSSLTLLGSYKGKKCAFRGENYLNTFPLNNFSLPPVFQVIAYVSSSSPRNDPTGWRLSLSSFCR
ncbi:ribonuclease P protein subunit p14 isoform X1 [Papio anubis]|uniref:ribonuclease P protein subunit p14 isoform X1 n=1 Tax=Papio anubis TaxID=9555 RepID=UPI00083EC527|nr:ribonuclease P protein subunit p14 isoform X1 [Papio anubis]XP_021789981.1 ribonuclease P protein subunit p14 isoform X1 [Papio anubis]XP_021789982.1 ribonuclease P protein subunit p14 isoform X1 [Papio anubis]XP_021789983.1 ribonuclease P protein subunit p14 isoform X1 [Papio anubis]XP_021789984.1 ribonuclease P protein subunit p14 isoform X1 [Papio anubis]